ncbi:MAG TPA: zf-HC2 domain-containing protein [Candidatus Kapabacteria bacterium]|nr:zf-HC2 domain-containing protein [Candidatus Kapabacteria bacterium]
MIPTEHDRPRGCTTTQELIDRYLSRELPGDMAHAIEEHAAECPDCGRILDERRRLTAGVKHAVNAEAPPFELEGRIRESLRSRRGGASIFTLEPRFRFGYAAAAILLIAIAAWGTIRYLNGERPDRIVTYNPQPERRNIPATPVSDVLRLGLSDHVQCAILHKQSEHRMTLGEMEAAVGSDYFGLVQLVRSHAGAFEIVNAHRCEAEGRPFVHLILRKGKSVISVVVTRKQGETLGSGPAVSVDSIPSVHMRLRDIREFDVTAFETDRFLAFVISEKDEPENGIISRAIAPEMRTLLGRVNT